MMWAMNYALKKIKIKSKKRGEKWEEIFQPRNPYKDNNIKNRNITKANILKEGAFTEQQYDIMPWTKRSSHKRKYTS